MMFQQDIIMKTLCVELEVCAYTPLEDFKALNRKDVVWLQDVSSEEEGVEEVPGVPGKKRRISSDL